MPRSKYSYPIFRMSNRCRHPTAHGTRCTRKQVIDGLCKQHYYATGPKINLFCDFPRDIFYEISRNLYRPAILAVSSTNKFLRDTFLKLYFENPKNKLIIKNSPNSFIEYINISRNIIVNKLTKELELLIRNNISADASLTITNFDLMQKYNLQNLNIKTLKLITMDIEVIDTLEIANVENLFCDCAIYKLIAKGIKRIEFGCTSYFDTFKLKTDKMEDVELILTNSIVRKIKTPLIKSLNLSSAISFFKHNPICDFTGIKCLNLRCCKFGNSQLIFDLDNLEVLDLSNTDIISIPKFKKVREIGLDYTDIYDITNLEGIHTISLRGCKNVTDFRCLGNAHTLDLAYTSLSVTTGLENVHTLNLRKTNVVNVNNLGRVKNLNLSYTRVADVSCLGEVPDLDLSNTQVKDVSKLSRVTRLNLSGTPVEDVSSLGKVKHLKLKGCVNLVDVSALGDNITLCLSECKNIKDFSNLGRVKCLILSGTNVENVEAFSECFYLDLYKTKVKDVSCLSNVYQLNLSDTQVCNVSYLEGVKILDITNTKVTSVSKLKNIKALNISGLVVPTEKFDCDILIKDTNTQNSKKWSKVWTEINYIWGGKW